MLKNFSVVKALNCGEAVALPVQPPLLGYNDEGKCSKNLKSSDLQLPYWLCY